MLVPEKPKLVLASASPRRQELLRQIGASFEVYPANLSEDQFPAEPPIEYAHRLAREKALKVAEKFPARYVLGADTIVVLDGDVLGKPADREDAAQMLRRLSGRTHEVTTAICLLTPDGQAETASTTTRVCFRQIAESEIQDYVATGEPMDKAGSYAIQGGASHWTNRIEGEYSNVVGLPLSMLTALLHKNGVL